MQNPFTNRWGRFGKKHFLQRASATLCTAAVILNAGATNHILRQDEIMVGLNGDPTIQFIQITVSDGTQKAWGRGPGEGSSRAMLVFFNTAGIETGRFLFPNNAPIGANTVLIATTNFAATGGAPVPDFLIPPLLSPAGGKVCFRGNPANGNAFGVNLCLSYGPIAPELTEGGGPPAPLPPIRGEPISLSRFRNFGFGGVNQNADFTLASPSPANTRGQTAVFSIPGPEIDFIPTNVDFGPRNMTLGPSAPLSITITNRGFANSLNISNVALVATIPALFAITSDSGQAVLPPGGTRTINVTFDPDSPGLKTAALRVVSNDENENISLVPLRGMGVDPNAPEIDTSLASVTFTNRDVAAGPSPVVLVGVRNLGNVGSLSITNLRLAGAHASQFRLAGPTNATTLPPGGNFTVSVVFDPDTAGPKTAVLRILSSDTDEGVLDVPLFGRAFDLNPCTAPNPTNSVAQNFATNAQVIGPGLLFTDTTLGATPDGASSCSPPQSPDVWYRYIPATDGSAIVSLSNSVSILSLSVHHALPGVETNQLACDNNVSPTTRLSFPVSQGVPLFIRIAGIPGAPSSFELTLAGPPALKFDLNENGVTDSCEFDFGDAPAPYPTTLAANGARHRRVGVFSFGLLVDSDDDGQPSPSAAGDNEDGPPNDEDGIIFATPMVAGQTASVFVTGATANAHLNAWVDFNADGDWADPGEQIFTNVLDVAGTIFLNPQVFSVPATAAITNRTFARFRLSSAAGLSFTGEAPDGEVEDYTVEILPQSQTPGQIGVRINEVLAGLNGDSSAQFVELEVNGEASKAWGPQGSESAGRAMLLFYDQAGRQTGRFVFPSNAPPGANTVLVATRAFAEQSGLTPDFIMPPEVIAIAGKVAFASNPDNRHFDIHIALAYGRGYFGSTDGAGPANPRDLAILHVASLQRVREVPFGLNHNSAFEMPNVATPRNTAGSTVALQPKSFSEQGRVLFTRETFRGNGRTCATCHVAGRDQFGLTPLTIASLPEDDPLFVFEHNVNLLKLTARSQPSDLRGEISGAAGTGTILSGSGDTYLIIGGQSLSGSIADAGGNNGFFQSVTEGDLNGPTASNGSERGLEAHNFLEHGRGLILENIDNFNHGEVFRASPHLLNLNLTAPFGLSGEFESLDVFSGGAVVQHFPKSLARISGIDFRHPTLEELSAMSTFMFGLTPSDTNRFNLDRFATTEAQKRGRALFFGDQGRCSKCHSGPVLALSDGSLSGSVAGVNENFNTGVANLLRNILDDMPTEPAGLAPGESTREFNTPPLFNIRLTPPFFHDGSAETLKEAVEFYDKEEFHNSPAGSQVGSILAANKPELVADVVAFLESLVDLPVDFTRTLDFGIHCPGSPMPGPLTVIITNHSANTVSLTNVVINGTNAAAFAITSDTGQTILPPGGTRSIQVAFVPTNFAFKQATLELTGVDTNLFGVFSFGVALEGADIDTFVQANVTALNFGTRDISAPPSPEMSIVITNNGSIPLDAGAFVVTGPDANEFVVNIGRDPIAPHEIRVIEVSFAPTRAGTKDAALLLPVLACNTDLIEIPLDGVATSTVDRFAWRPVAGTQYVGRPFAVQITAQDRNGNTVETFTGTVRIFVSSTAGFDDPPLPLPRTGPFVSGVWTGSVTIPEPRTLSTIASIDSQGHSGNSDEFIVLFPDDLSLAVTNSPNPNPSGQVITYELSVRNTGPTASTDVVITNQLSPNVSFVSAVASQGTVGHSGGIVIAELGSLASGAAATVTIRAEPILGSTNVVNIASVTRIEPELILTNNVATNATPIGAFGVLVVRPATNFMSSGFSGGPFTPTNQIYSLSNAGTAPLTWQVRAGGCILPEGIAGWWPLEGNAEDLAGTNRGVLLGNPTFTNGLAGQALSFDGNDDAVRIAASPALNVGAGNGFTVEAWVQLPDINRRGPVFEWNDGMETIGNQLWVSHPTPGALFANLFDGTNHHVISTPGNLLQQNVWQHIALTYSKLTGMAVIYVNGTNVTQADLGVFTPLTTLDLWLGQRAASETLLGSIDEPGVFGREMSEEEIQAIASSRGASRCTNPAGGGCFQPDGIAAWWPLGGNASDVIGTNAGVLSGNPVFTNGLVGRAMLFDGTDDAVRIPAAPALNVGRAGGFTIEAWINPTVVTTERPVVEWVNAAGNGTHFWISVASGEGGSGSLFANIFSIGGVAHHVSSEKNIVTTNVWQHIAVTYNTNTGLALLYHDGELLTGQNIGSFVPNTTGDLLIGRRAPLSFAGGIDEVSIYHRELSQAEIQALAASRGSNKCANGTVGSESGNCNLPGGLVAWWPLDGNTLDLVGTNHGGLLGNPVFTNGFVGQGMFFDGNNDAVKIPASPELNVGTNDGYTFEVWLSVPNITRRNPVFQFDNPGEAFSGTFTFVSANTPGSIHAGLIQVGNIDHSFVSAPNLVSANAWAHLAVTYNRLSGIGTIYVNGVSVLQQNLGSFISKTTGTLSLGHRGSAGGEETFQGTLDEAALYNRDLSAAEVQAIFLAGSNGKCRGRSWFGFSAQGGTLAANATTNLNVFLNTNALSLAVGSYSDVLTITNASNGRGSTERTVSLTVLNRPPTLAPLPPIQLPEDPGPHTVNLANIRAGGSEQQSLTVTAFSSNPGLIANPIMVNYTSPSANGALVFAPLTNAHGMALVSVVVRDDAGTAKDGIDAVTNTFLLTVTPVNDAPAFVLTLDQTVNEGDALMLTSVFTDPDLPNDQLAFNLLAGPSGMALNPATGVISWTPTEAQGPSTNNIFLTVSDNGTPSLHATNRFVIVVAEVNSAPSLAAVADRIVHEGMLVTWTAPASDQDLPGNRLTYGLAAGAPAGANVNPLNGSFNWIAQGVPVPGTNTIIYTVSDDGTPALTDSRSCRVIVVRPPRITEIHRSGANIALTWTAIPGLRYQVQFKDNLSQPDWNDLPGEILATGQTATKADTLGLQQRFYRIQVGNE